jgi:glycosyltransferase involved in cell wall biosynthesis
MTVSITIPCLNEKDYISKCLNSIVNCTFTKNNLNVYVCDGMSTDGTREIIGQYCSQYSFIHLLNNTQKTTPFALNLGLKEGNAEIKIILGAHSEIYPDFITHCITAFEADSKIGCVGGIIENVFNDSKSESISLAMSSVFGVGTAHFRTGVKEGFVDTVAFGAYKSEVFDAVGFFDEELVRNQDDEFNYRLSKAGFKIYLSKNIRSKYYVRASFKKLFKQYYQYGYWKVFVNMKHKTITTGRQLVPAIFVLFIVSSILITPLFSEFLPFVLSIYFVYFLLALMAAFRIVNKVKKAPQVVASFFILHISYGIGYLEGIVNFMLLKNKPVNRLSKTSR